MELWIEVGSHDLAPVLVGGRVWVGAVGDGLGCEAPSLPISLDVTGLGHPAVTAAAASWGWAEKVDDVAGLVVGGGRAEVLGPVGDCELGVQGLPLGVCRLGLVVIQVPASVDQQGLDLLEVDGHLVDVCLIRGQAAVGSVEVLFGVLQGVAGGAAERPLGELDGAGGGPAALLLEAAAVGV